MNDQKAPEWKGPINSLQTMLKEKEESLEKVSLHKALLELEVQNINKLLGENNGKD